MNMVEKRMKLENTRQKDNKNMFFVIIKDMRIYPSLMSKVSVLNLVAVIAIWVS